MGAMAAIQHLLAMRAIQHLLDMAAIQHPMAAIQPPLVILEDLVTATLTSSTVDMEAMSIMLMEVLVVAFSRVEILLPPVSTRVWHMEVDMDPVTEDLEDMAIQPLLVILED